jgi:hypothetical protein
MDDEVKRREVTPEEQEEVIRHLEKNLETRSGDDSKKLQENIRRLKEIVLIMLAGTVKIFHRIPVRLHPPE